MPTSAAKSSAGNPLRCQVSSSNSVARGHAGGRTSAGFTSRGRPPRRGPISRAGVAPSSRADGVSSRSAPSAHSSASRSDPTASAAADQEAPAVGAGSAPRGLRPRSAPPSPTAAPGDAAETLPSPTTSNPSGKCSDMTPLPRATPADIRRRSIPQPYSGLKAEGVSGCGTGASALVQGTRTTPASACAGQPEVRVDRAVCLALGSDDPGRHAGFL